MTLDYQTLKEQHRKIRESQPDDVKLKIHRALSWLKAAESQEQSDTKYLLLWIAFNAIYSREFEQEKFRGEKSLYNNFISKLVKLDKDNLIYKIVWDNYSGHYRVFIENRFVFRKFWDFVDEKTSEQEWKDKFEKEKKSASIYLVKKDTANFLSILFDRLYILRNQLMHGGATFESKINRAQIRDGLHILEQIVPIIIQIVMDNSQEEWGSPSFLPVR